jgi:nitrite reductase (NADH) small subunit
MKQETAWIDLGLLEQIPLGLGRCFQVKGEEIAVFRPRSGELKAIDNRCPHKKGPLAEGIIGNNKVVCPLHGHKFDLSTGEGSEAQECLRVFKVREVNGKILLEWPV